MLWSTGRRRRNQRNPTQARWKASGVVWCGVVCECGVSVCAGRIPGEVRCDGTVPAAAGWLTGGRPVLGASLGGHRRPRPLAGTLPSSQDTPSGGRRHPIVPLRPAPPPPAAGPLYARVTRRSTSVRGHLQRSARLGAAAC